jgi:hypothetical protein
MNCPCDKIVFPPPLVIHAGLAHLPRQLATFPEFRTALLSAIGTQPVLKDWRARSSDDFGVMLLEMWSYVCDSLTFYDEVIANETYLRTAQLRPSLRKLVALLGYLPRPAVAARVELAILAEGRRPITLPLGTAFRSGGFPGGSPQVFELDAVSRAHPFTNKWTLARTRPATLEPGPSFQMARTTFLFDPKRVTLKPDQLVLVQDLHTPSNTRVRHVVSVDDFSAADGTTYKQAVLSQSVPIPGNRLLTHVRLSHMTQTGTIFLQPVQSVPMPAHTSLDDVLLSRPIQVRTIFLRPRPSFSSGLFEDAGRAFVFFDSLHRQIQVGDSLVLERSGDFRWFTVDKMGEEFVNLPAPAAATITDASNHTTTIKPPAPQVQVTWVQLDVSFNDPSRRELHTDAWQSTDAASIKVHFGFRPAGTLTVPADLTLKPGDPMRLIPPLEAPQDNRAPSRFLLEDKDTNGVAHTASIEFVAGRLTPTRPLAQPLVAPVTVYGNVVNASRGETVASEVLGSGDGSVANQTFKLKKSPLTYLPAPTGVTSTLKVYVNGLRWTEVPSFFGVASEAQVYIVRQNDDGESFVTFGDGSRGCRLPSGSNNVIASYRFGAGKASPSAGSIHQMAKPVQGISSVRNPVAAAGGDDAEAASGLRTYAPRSALLLGRAISMPDMEAAAASVSGVRAVRAEWRWNSLRQRPLVQVWYIGAVSIAKDVIQKLRGLSDSVTPIAVELATPVVGILSLSIEIDPRRIEADVLADIRTALMDAETGLLAPERIGIGLPLFRSRIFETVLAVPGTLAVAGLLWNGNAFDSYGIEPGAGKYFDFEHGTLLLNGKADANG